MKKQRLMTLALALLTGSCQSAGPREPAPPSPPTKSNPGSDSREIECTSERLPGALSGTQTGGLLLSLGEKPMLSRPLGGLQSVTVEERKGQLVLKLGTAPAVQCELQIKCTSSSFLQLDPEQQCVFNFSSLSPAHTEDVVFELLKGEGSVGGGLLDLRLDWKAKSRREYDRATGRLSVDLAVGTMQQMLRLGRR